MGDDLIRRAQQGDRDAVESLFRREWQPVYRLLYRTLGNRHQAEDLTQEVFIRALSSLDRFKQRSTPFAGYLAVVARNLLRDEWRKRGLRLTALDAADTVPSASDGPERAALAGEEGSRGSKRCSPRYPPITSRSFDCASSKDGQPTRSPAS